MCKCFSCKDSFDFDPKTDFEPCLLESEVSETNTGYSEAELKLIKAISPHWYGVVHKAEVSQPSLYNILAHECFIENKRGSEVDALRRACKALSECRVYRMTEEFDQLCEFDLPDIETDNIMDMFEIVEVDDDGKDYYTAVLFYKPDIIRVPLHSYEDEGQLKKDCLSLYKSHVAENKITDRTVMKIYKSGNKFGIAIF